MPTIAPPSEGRASLLSRPRVSMKSVYMLLPPSFSHLASAFSNMFCACDGLPSFAAFEVRLAFASILEGAILTAGDGF